MFPVRVGQWLVQACGEYIYEARIFRMTYDIHHHELLQLFIRDGVNRIRTVPATFIWLCF